MSVYGKVMVDVNHYKFIRWSFELENDLHQDLAIASNYIASIFAITHVRVGYEEAVKILNKALSRIDDLYDMGLTEHLSGEIDNDTLFIIDAMVISGYEQGILEELIKLVVKTTDCNNSALKPLYRI